MSTVIEFAVIFAVAAGCGLLLGKLGVSRLISMPIGLVVALLAGRLVNPKSYKNEKED